MLSKRNFDRMQTVRSENVVDAIDFVLSLYPGIVESIVTHKAMFNGKQANILAGLTGAGKTTNVNYFIGTPLKRVKERGKWVVDVDVDSDECPESYPKIGHRTTAETSIAAPYEDKEGRFVFTDSPGQEENRSEKKRILSSLALKFAIQECDAVKSFLVTVNYNHLTERLTKDFSGFINFLKNTFGDNLDELVKTGNILFLITKANVENEDGRIVTASVEDILDIVKHSKSDFKRQLRGEDLTRNDINDFEAKIYFLELLENNYKNIIPINPIKNIGKDMVFEKLSQLDMPIAKNMIRLDSESLNLLSGKTMVLARYFNQVFSQLKYKNIRLHELNGKIKKLEKNNEFYESDIKALTRKVKDLQKIVSKIEENKENIYYYEKGINKLKGGEDVELKELREKLERIKALIKEINYLENLLRGIPKNNIIRYLHEKVDIFDIGYNGKNKHYSNGVKERGGYWDRSWSLGYTEPPWTKISTQIQIDKNLYSDVEKDYNASISPYKTSCEIDKVGDKLFVKYKSYGNKEYCKLKIFYKRKELNPDYMDIQNQLNIARRELKREIAPYASTDQAIKAIKANISHLEKKHSDRTNAIRKYKAEIQRLKKENDDLVRQHGTMGDLQVKLGELKAKKSSLEKKLAKAEMKIETYEATVKSLNKEAEKLESALSEDSSAYECLNYIFDIVGVEENADAAKFVTSYKKFSDTRDNSEELSSEETDENDESNSDSEEASQTGSLTSMLSNMFS